MKSHLLLKIIIFLSNFAICQQAIAVIDFNANNISDGEVKALTDRLRVELFKTKNYNVVEREMMDEVLKEQGFQQSGCATDECMVQIGRLVGVQSIVGGSISKVGSTFSISSRIVSVETGDIINTSTYDHKGEIDGLLTIGMKQIVEGFFENEENPQLIKNSVPLKSTANVINELTLDELEENLTNSQMDEYLQGKIIIRVDYSSSKWVGSINSQPLREFEVYELLGLDEEATIIKIKKSTKTLLSLMGPVFAMSGFSIRKKAEDDSEWGTQELYDKSDTGSRLLGIGTLISIWALLYDTSQVVYESKIVDLAEKYNKDLLNKIVSP